MERAEKLGKFTRKEYEVGGFYKKSAETRRYKYSINEKDQFATNNIKRGSWGYIQKNLAIHTKEVGKLYKGSLGRNKK